jgi:hypothetical protein
MVNGVRIIAMDKYEIRRQRLLYIRDNLCGGKAVDVARTLDGSPSYVSRMLYPEGKKQKKRIADEMVELIESSFNLPRGWMDGITGNIDIEREPVEDSPQMPYVIEVLMPRPAQGRAALSPVRLMKR